jgi:hypothetical protein
MRTKLRDDPPSSARRSGLSAVLNGLGEHHAAPDIDADTLDQRYRSLGPDQSDISKWPTASPSI